MKNVLLVIIALIVNFSSFGQGQFLKKTLNITKKTLEFNPKRINNNSLLAINLLAQRDSSYYWMWDVNTNNWESHPNSKTLNYVYNSNNYITSLLRQNWNGTTWTPSGQFYFTYDLNNNNTSNYGQYWSGSVWVNGYKYLYTYDANNNQTSYLYQTGNASNWVNSDQEFYTYDSNNNQISFLSQTWNGSSWDNVNQIMMTYDVNNNLISQEYKLWNSNSWVDLFKSTYVYDVNNNQLNELSQNWNGSSWENSHQTINTYNINNNKIGLVSQIWNGSGWDNDQKGTMSYDINNRIVYELYEQWNGVAWENMRQIFSTHGANNAIVTNGLYQNWNGNTWVNSNKFDQPRDNNGFVQYEAFKYWNNLGTHITSGDSTYHYSHVLAGINELNLKSINSVIFPNPSNSSLSIKSNVEYDNINIINSIGQTVATIEDKPTIISVSDLSNGIYFIHLLDKKGTLLKTEKFIKE